MTAATPPRRLLWSAPALEMAKAHRQVALQVAYTMPRTAAQSRHLMRLYALQARGKSPAS